MTTSREKDDSSARLNSLMHQNVYMAEVVFKGPGKYKTIT